jgi:hypothetical protein
VTRVSRILFFEEKNNAKKSFLIWESKSKIGTLTRQIHQEGTWKKVLDLKKIRTAGVFKIHPILFKNLFSQFNFKFGTLPLIADCCELTRIWPNFLLYSHSAVCRVKNRINSVNVTKFHRFEFSFRIPGNQGTSAINCINLIIKYYHHLL